jgi:ankyrin repeat protein
VALVDAGAKLDIQNDKQDSSIMCAVEYDNLEVIRALVKAGATQDVNNKDGWTPLYIAAANTTNPEIITELVKSGAKVDYCAPEGWREAR